MKQIKLMNKKDYLRVLTFLEDKTKYIELLQLLGDENESAFLEQHKEQLISQKYVSNWLDSGSKGLLSKFDFSLHTKKEFFQKLREADAFFITM